MKEQVKTTIRLLTVFALAGCSRDTRQPATRDSARSDSAATRPSASSASSNEKPDYIGLQYDSLPKDFTYRDGSLIPPSAATHNAEYDLSHVMTPSGEMIWLDTLGAPVGKGLRAKIVRAELTIPQLANDERLFMASCDSNGKLDPLVVAIVVNQPGATKFTSIRQAWRVNIPAARFDVIPVAGISCEEPGR
jgi:hypothetical protein